MSKERILIVYVDIGKGHYKAAAAVKEEFERRGVHAEMKDFLSHLPKAYHIFMKEAYLRIVKYFPQAYNLAYKFTTAMDRNEAKVYANIVSLSVYPFVEKMYRDYLPDIVISTHPITTLSFAHLKDRTKKDLKIVSILTDFHLINFFLARQVDLFVVPHEEVVESYVKENGLPQVRVEPFGIPVSKKFTESFSPQEAKRRLGLEREKNIALVMAGGLGFSHVVEVAEAISGTEFDEPVAIACLAGKNNNAFEKLRELEKTKARTNRIYYVDWTDDVWLYMKAASMIISKAGGSTIAEASVSSLPFVVYKPIPGQEYLNTNFLLQHKAALHASHKAQLGDFVNEVLFSGKGGMLKSNISKLAKPKAAEDLVDAVTELL